MADSHISATGDVTEIIVSGCEACCELMPRSAVQTRQNLIRTEPCMAEVYSYSEAVDAVGFVCFFFPGCVFSALLQGTQAIRGQESAAVVAVGFTVSE